MILAVSRRRDLLWIMVPLSVVILDLRISSVRPDLHEAFIKLIWALAAGLSQILNGPRPQRRSSSSPSSSERGTVSIPFPCCILF